jgi:hypothetical protein
MFDFKTSKDMKKDAVNFGRQNISEHEGGAPSLKS